MIRNGVILGIEKRKLTRNDCGADYMIRNGVIFFD